MNPVIDTIKTRRSVRSYTEQAVPQELLAEVLEAGRCAPSGGNSQSTHFVVIRSMEVLESLRACVSTCFARMEVTEGMYPNLVRSIQMAKKGGYDFLYGAPVFVMTANRRGYPNAELDCCCALENMMIAAHSLGLGSCYINQLWWLKEDPELRRFIQSLGILPEEFPCGGLTLGYPQHGQGAMHTITGNPVTYIG